MTDFDIALSKAVSHALRHEPWLYELELDEQGLVPVTDLLSVLRGRGGSLHEVTREDLARMVASAAKQRHELQSDRIRARYGHSVPGKVAKVPALPPAVLFHGTSPSAWTEIERVGLRPMGRQYVHLSTDVEMAERVGLRKAASPVIIVVHAAGAAADGVVFFQGNDRVWLADEVPAAFLGGAPSAQTAQTALERHGQ